jgi:hypothetical protein
MINSVLPKPEGKSLEYKGKCYAKPTVPLQLADKIFGVDCVRNIAKISVVST